MDVQTPITYWPFLGYCLAILTLTGVMVGLPMLLGQRHLDRATGSPYESGIAPTGGARLHFSAQYYLVGLFFVIFDLEAVFIYAWGIALFEVGWAGYVEVLIFIGVLVATLAYLWRLGALDWH